MEIVSHKDLFFNALTKVFVPIVNGVCYAREASLNSRNPDRTFREIHKRKGLLHAGNFWTQESRDSAIRMLRREYERSKTLIYADAGKPEGLIKSEDENEIAYSVNLRNLKNPTDWVRLDVSEYTTIDEFLALTERMKVAADMEEARKIFPERAIEIMTDHVHKIIDSKRFENQKKDDEKKP